LLKLMYITNQPDVAKTAEDAGVDIIFVDLEIIGKKDRQGHLDTVISDHSISDVYRIKETLKHAELLVRVNPIYPGSKEEIDDVCRRGADIIMLPFFTTKKEAEVFVDLVDNRAKTCLLVETPEAVANIDDILSLGDIDMVHIGLNDLHLGYGMKFMFELLADGTVEMLCEKIASKGIPYGFGGVARVGFGVLPSEYIIAEHYRLGSDMVILSRSFCNVNKVNRFEEIKDIFALEVKKIRSKEREASSFCETEFVANREQVRLRVGQYVKNLPVLNKVGL